MPLAHEDVFEVRRRPATLDGTLLQKAELFFALSRFCCKADFRSVNLTSEVISSMRLWRVYISQREANDFA